MLLTLAKPRRSLVLRLWSQLLRAAEGADAALMWPFRVAENRRVMAVLGEMSDHDLRDIGVTRGDLRDATALPASADPSRFLRQSAASAASADRRGHAGGDRCPARHATCVRAERCRGSLARRSLPGARTSPLLVLLGIPILVIGFVVGLNPLLVVALAGTATGLLAGLDPLAVLSAFGKAFVQNRYIGIVWLVVPVIGLLERCGLRERAQTLIAGLRVATTGRVLLVYLVVRQISAALGLTSLGGHAQMVRPLIAPMAEAAEERHGPIAQETRMVIRAHAAAVDNIGVFFGEDVFIAIGSILLIKGFLQQNGIVVAPLDLAVWAIPTAVLAFVVHGTRLALLDRRLKRRRLAASDAAPDEAAA